MRKTIPINYLLFQEILNLSHKIMLHASKPTTAAAAVAYTFYIHSDLAKTEFYSIALWYRSLRFV